MKIAVAMSGGVDSSVAAALMTKEYGTENVFGVTMKLFCYGDEEGSEKSCCSLDAIADAASVCKQLGIPHYVVNLEKEFQKDVIDNFISQYAAGMTPNPCIRCNQLVKYEYLLKKAMELGADKLVTGHYARVNKLKINNSKLKSDEFMFEYKLLKGLDNKKDQSYFLYNLTQNQLAHVEFPIGGLEKTETRKLAKELGLKTAEKTESQDICFVTTTTQDFLGKRIDQKPGNIVDAVGNILGHHNGLAQFTIGQRKGLGGGFSEPTYVIGLNVGRNEVIVGGKEDLYSSELGVDEIHWISGKTPEMPFSCTAKIRYNSSEAKCEITNVTLSGTKGPGLDSSCGQNDGFVVTFETPQLAITPGQSIVFYLNEEVLGGGIILSAVSS